jgi:octaprenyl-diphosphate synthase
MHPAESRSAPVSLDALRGLVGDDWAAVNRMIYRRLGSDVALVNQVAHHIIHHGGKRLRPLAVLLAARACGCDREDHIAAAAIIEFIHTATLLHDDVVDSSEMRRGQSTANSLFGNQASVLVGDFLYSRSFQMMVDIGELKILEVLANATNTIAEGRSAAADELQQPGHQRSGLHGSDLSQDREAVRGRHAHWRNPGQAG